MTTLFQQLHYLLQNERQRLVLWTPVALALGIGLYFALPFEPVWWWSVAANGLCLLATIGLWRWLGWRLLALGLLLMSVGFSAAVLRTQSVSTSMIYGELFYRAIEGTVDDIEIKENKTRITLSEPTIEDFPADKVPRRINVSFKKMPPEPFYIGDRISAKAMLFEAPSPTMPGSYDFARMYFFKEIGAVGFAPNAPTLLSREGTRGFDQWLKDLRLSISERIITGMSSEGGPVASAMMVGEESAISESVREAMRDSGIYHVLSISGLHMTLAAGILFFALRFMLVLYPPWALRLPTKKIAAALGLLGAFVYLFLAGYPVPAVRSFIMVACVMGAILVDRQGISLYSLAWAATIILLIWPESLLGVSFQLSFAATVAIVALYERYAYLLNQSHVSIPRKLWIYLLGIMLTSLVATLATMPFVIYHFNRMALFSIGANMLMMPLASMWIMPLAVVSFLAMPFGLEHAPLQALDWGISLMIDGARWVAGFEYATVNLPSLTMWGVLLATFGGLWLCVWQGRHRLIGVPLVVAGLCTIALYQPYDLLINDDGKKIALRTGKGEYVFLRGTPTSYEAEMWMRAEGGVGLRRSETKSADCTRALCRVDYHGKVILVGLKKETKEALCTKDADMVISSERLDSKACQHVPLVIDHNYLWKSGAVGIRFSDEEMVVDKASTARGHRPWVAKIRSRYYTQ